jgi:hypothetical protein
MKIFLLITAFILIILYEVPGLIRKKYWRELVAFSALLSIAFFVSLMQTLNIKIPDPVRDTQYFVKNLMHIGYE